MASNQSPTNPDALVSLIERVKENYQEPPPSPPKRGKKRDFSALSFLLLAVVAVTMRTFRDSELRKLLEKDQKLREALGFERVPHRTCIGRRLSGLAPEAERQIALLGQRIIEEVRPDDGQPKVSATRGRMYKAQGPKWHKGDRQKELVPVGLRNVDIESKWSRSGYRGWVQGYRLVVQGLAFPEPVPIFAAWRPNNENEADIAIEALLAGKLKVTDALLGDETQRLRPLPLSLRRGRRMGPLTEAAPSRATVVEGRLVRLSQRDHRTALSTDHSSNGLE